jgi:hypothetical protein
MERSLSYPASSEFSSANSGMTNDECPMRPPASLCEALRAGKAEEASNPVPKFNLGTRESGEEGSE